jgi:hypothetical protein
VTKMSEEKDNKSYIPSHWFLPSLLSGRPDGPLGLLTTNLFLWWLGHAFLAQEEYEMERCDPIPGDTARKDLIPLPVPKHIFQQNWGKWTSKGSLDLSMF